MKLNLIINENTGSPKDLAVKLKVSERAVSNLLETLKDFDAEIRYSKRKCSFIYVNMISLSFNVWSSH
jgi:biotin operon repressor